MAYYQSKDKIKHIQLPICQTVVGVFCDVALPVGENSVYRRFVSRNQCEKIELVGNY